MFLLELQAAEICFLFLRLTFVAMDSPLTTLRDGNLSAVYIYIYIYYILKNATKIENNLFKIRNIPPLLEAIYIYINTNTLFIESAY